MSGEAEDEKRSFGDWVVYYFRWWLPNFILLFLALALGLMVFEFLGGYLDPYITEELSFVSCFAQFAMVGLIFICFYGIASFTPMGREWMGLDEDDTETIEKEE